MTDYDDHRRSLGLTNHNVFKLLNSKSPTILKLFANFINECLQIRQVVLKKA